MWHSFPWKLLVTLQHRPGAAVKGGAAERSGPFTDDHGLCYPAAEKAVEYPREARLLIKPARIKRNPP